MLFLENHVKILVFLDVWFNIYISVSWSALGERWSTSEQIYLYNEIKITSIKWRNDIKRARNLQWNEAIIDRLFCLYTASTQGTLCCDNTSKYQMQLSSKLCMICVGTNYNIM